MDIVIFGTGGHSKVVYDILIKQQKYNPVAFVSLDKGLSTFMGLPHFHQSDLFRIKQSKGIVAIGDNYARAQVSSFILEKRPDFDFVMAVHPSAQVAYGVKIGRGSVVMANTALNSETVLGENVIINTGATVDHDCKIDSFASIAPGCTLGGNVTLGAFAALSLGAKVVHNKKIGIHTVVGAGSVVLNDIADYKIAYGSPCRVIRDRKEGEKYL
jgi:sugar O-acyltransferase (sialic acid O-acetyltransferase NeuD family)